MMMRAVLRSCAVLAACQAPPNAEGREAPPSPAAKPAAKPSAPVEVRAIGAGETTACALLSDGDVRCWLPGAKPGSVGISAAIALSVGTRHACVAKSDGSVWCWGGNNDGQLGDGTTTEHPMPLRVEGVAKIVEVGVGGFYSCARDQAGAVWCWGQPTFGGKRPTRIAAPAARSIVAGEETVCLTFEKAPPRCWGFNVGGSLGDEIGPLAKPTAKTPFADATTFAIGARHACLVSQGVVFCAGEDRFGQLGDQHVPDMALCTPDERDHTVKCEWVEYPPPEPPRPAGEPPPPMDRERPAAAKHRKETFLIRNGYANPAIAGVAVVIGEYQTCAIDQHTNAVCWGLRWRNPTPIANTHGAVALAVGSHDACALLADHSVRCWGEGKTATPVAF